MFFSKHPIFKLDFWEKTQYSNMIFSCFLVTPVVSPNHVICSPFVCFIQYHCNALNSMPYHTIPSIYQSIYPSIYCRVPNFSMQYHAVRRGIQSHAEHHLHHQQGAVLRGSTGLTVPSVH